MKFSIIIPVYNVEKYIEECVTSALSLKTDVEIILVDDGSTDKSGEICDSLALNDSRIKVIHKSNGGLSDARNYGINAATGDYLLFLDSDDFFNVPETERMLNFVDGKSEVIVGLYNNFYEADSKYEPENAKQFLQNTGKLSKEQFLEVIPNDGSGCFLISCRFAVSTDFIKRNELFFTKGIYHEDEEWTSRMLLMVDGVHLTDCLFYNYRQARSGSIMAGVKPKHIEDSLIIAEGQATALKKYNANSVESKFLQRRIAMLVVNVLLNLNVLSKDEKLVAINRLKLLYACCHRGFSRKSKLIKYFISLFGIKFTAIMIGFVKGR